MSTDNLKLLSIKEVAARMGVANNTVRRWICHGLIKAHRYGGKIISIHENDLQEFLNGSVVDVNLDPKRRR